MQALHRLVTQFESNFGVVAIQFLEEKNLLRESQPPPAMTSTGWIVVSPGVPSLPSMFAMSPPTSKVKRLMSRGSVPNFHPLTVPAPSTQSKFTFPDSMLFSKYCSLNIQHLTVVCTCNITLLYNWFCIFCHFVRLVRVNIILFVLFVLDLATSPALSNSSGSISGSETSSPTLRRAASHSSFNSPQSNIYSTVWKVGN